MTPAAIIALIQLLLPPILKLLEELIIHEKASSKQKTQAKTLLSKLKAVHDELRA